MSRYYLAYWCNEGFESIQDISKYEKWEENQLIEILASRQTKSEPSPLGVMVGAMKMRARVNPQREYELYAFMATDELEYKAIDDWMQADPQTLVDWIRKNGTKLHSDRRTTARRIIS